MDNCPFLCKVCYQKKPCWKMLDYSICFECSWYPKDQKLIPLDSHLKECVGFSEKSTIIKEIILKK